MRSRFVAVWCLLTSSLVMAHVPDAEEDCRNQRSATCRINGITYQVDGPCREGSETIKAYDPVDCAEVARQALAAQPPTSKPVVPPVAPAPTSAPRVELLLIPVGLFALGAMVAWFRIRRLRQRGASVGLIVFRWLISSALGVGLGLAAALSVFGAVVRHYSNADTAGPVLIASAAAFGAFAVVSAIGSLLIGFALNFTALKLPKSSPPSQ